MELELDYVSEHESGAFYSQASRHPNEACEVNTLDDWISNSLSF